MPFDPDQPAAVAWRDWATGADEARASARPMLVSLDPGWTTAGQRLDLVAGRDARLRRALEDACVPVRLDPFADGARARRLGRAIARQAVHPGPPGLALLSPGGAMLAPFTSLVYEGRAGAVASLAGLIEAAADGPAGDVAPDPQPRLPAAEPLRLRPRRLLRLAQAARADPGAAAPLRARLDPILRGGVRDQIGRGFHRAARDGRWFVPHFEKLLPDNAWMAAALAASARALGDRGLARIAAETAGFVLDRLRADPLAQAVAADSHHYTWTPREFAAVVPRQAAKTAALLFHMTQAQVAHVLIRARSPEQIAAFGHQPEDRIVIEIGQACAALRAARDMRPAPPVVSARAPDWTAATLAGLARAAALGVDGIEAAELEDLRRGAGLPGTPQGG